MARALPSLMTLPKELRLRILECACEDLHPEITCSVGIAATCHFRLTITDVLAWTWCLLYDRWIPSRSAPYESGIAIVCKQLRSEFFPVLCANSYLSISSSACAMLFNRRARPSTLDTMNRLVFSHVRSIHLGKLSSYLRGARLAAFMSNFPALQTWSSTYRAGYELQDTRPQEIIRFFQDHRERIDLAGAENKKLLKMPDLDLLQNLPHKVCLAIGEVCGTCFEHDPEESDDPEDPGDFDDKNDPFSIDGDLMVSWSAPGMHMLLTSTGRDCYKEFGGRSYDEGANYTLV